MHDEITRPLILFIDSCNENIKINVTFCETKKSVVV